MSTAVKERSETHEISGVSVTLVDGETVTAIVKCDQCDKEITHQTRDYFGSIYCHGRMRLESIKVPRRMDLQLAIQVAITGGRCELKAKDHRDVQRADFEKLEAAGLGKTKRR